MNLSAPFIGRPVMTTLIMAGILIFGMIAYRTLPVSDLPNVDYPVIVVSAALPGANPETMASAVATPLEKQFSTIPGITSMTSASRSGLTQITLQFDLNRNIDAAAQDVQAAIALAERQLPPSMPSPPSYRKVNPALQPILYIGLTSKTMPLYELDDYAEGILAQQISMIEGVAQVQVNGSQQYAVRIQVDPNRLASYGIGIDEVRTAVAAANANEPTGILDGTTKAFTVQASGQLRNADQFKQVIVAYRGGRPIRLEELGLVLDSVANDKTAAWFNNERGIILGVQRQPGSNTVAVADAVKAILPKFKESLPASVDMDIIFDLSQEIRASVHDVKVTLFIAIALVVLVIFVFLRNASATIIPSLALPMSVIGTFAVMARFHFTLDILSLMALTLSMGFVVDDAIVMLENIVRHMEAGEKPLEAAYKGSREISFTILSMTLALVAVFIPVLFMGGLVGRLFHEFAITITAAILISGFVSLTLTPMLSSRFLRPPSELLKSKFYRVSEQAFQRMLKAYERGLTWSTTHKRITMAYSALVLVLTVLLFMKMPKTFFPSEDTGRIFAFTRAEEGISFAAMSEHQEAAAAVAAADPNVEAFLSGVGGFFASNQGILLMRLTPKPKRKLDPDRVIAEMRPKFGQIPGLDVYLQNLPPISLGSSFGQSQFQFALQAINTDRLYKTAGDMIEKIRGVRGLLDVTSDLLIHNPQVDVTIDRDMASSLGVTADQIESALAAAYGSVQISTIYAPNNTYDVILELLPEYQLEPADLSALYIRSSQGILVPLSAVARINETVGPASINHIGQIPSVTISFDLEPGVALGTAVADVQKLAKANVPPDVTPSFQGTAQVFQSSSVGLAFLLAAAIAVIYLVLGILYESFIHPITILSALPFAGFGGLLTLLIFHYQLSIYAYVGIIMLVGLVKKNGIMMIDFALVAQRDQKKTPEEAIHQACMIRFRPIMMTSMAALMGTLPIAIGFGAGADARRPLGLAVVGGLVFSQFLTLFVTPVFYLYMDRVQHLFRRRRGAVERPIDTGPALG